MISKSYATFYLFPIIAPILSVVIQDVLFYMMLCKYELVAISKNAENLTPFVKYLPVIGVNNRSSNAVFAQSTYESANSGVA